MSSKPYLVSTASDKKYGDFLIEHWYASLKDNVDLKKIDLLVLDYGLSKSQKFYLEKNKVKVYPCIRDGHVVNLRFRDLLDFLNKHKYKQILTCDGGDIIFQADISHLFEEHREEYRAVCEDLAPFFEFFITKDYFYEEDIKELKEILLFKKMINAGLVLAPYEKMKFLCKTLIEKTKDKYKFGPDQILINYVLHKYGFIELPTKYNFIPVTSLDPFILKDGFFYDQNQNKIPVVHNAGNLNFFRAIENFGYGNGYNILKEDILKALRTLYNSLHLVNKPKKDIILLSKKIEEFIRSTTKFDLSQSYEVQKKYLESFLKFIDRKK
ncbi:MAG: glycosyl transferase family 8 [Leptonema sp. (in: bacteria)]